ncbi:hypothetical protein J4Q44_G00385220 [Coregonus suidteri]|uniref:Aminopeptidase P N-terminal domain-containing protein n=1 Tax=Coregonus suidteri TaxID=861788 RepID=A0AAN8Q4N7_9TELE
MLVVGCRMKSATTCGHHDDRLSNWCQGHLWCPCRNVSVGGWKPRKVPPRYLGQLSPFTHPHLIKNDEVTPGLTQTEFDLRRQRLASLIEVQADRLGPTASSNKHLVIVLSHSILYMTNDIPYPFHQNQDFLYLYMHPRARLLPGSVWYRPPGPSHPLRTPQGQGQGAVGRAQVREGRGGSVDGGGEGPLHKSLKGSTVWYDGSKPSHPGLHQTHVRPLLEGLPMVRSLRPLTHSLKSPAEVALMKEAGRITAQAFKKTMGMSQGDIDEALLYAKFDFECPNTFHYINNNQIVKNGEMGLLDGGCEYFCYVSDITRTWPVNGKFSPAQAELYEGVLEVQKACLSLCSPGVSLDHIYSTMLALLGRLLKQLGIVKSSTSDADALKGCTYVRTMTRFQSDSVDLG